MSDDNSPEIIKHIDEKCIILTINQEHMERYNNDVYEASRHIWDLNIKRAQKAELILVSFGRIVVGVFSNLSWYKENGGISFDGEPAQKSISNKYMGKIISFDIIKGACKNPRKYINL